MGRNNSGIAAALFLTERAVEKHINAIFSKLDLSEEPDVHRRVKAALVYLVGPTLTEIGGDELDAALNAVVETT